MALTGFFSRKPGRFVSEDGFRNNMALQSKMTPQTMEQLRKIGVTEAHELKLEYFFHTNTEGKAAALAAELKALDYPVTYEVSASNKKNYVTGWSTPMLMRDELVLAWTRTMCQMGNTHDCEFDGWGTTPSQ